MPVSILSLLEVVILSRALFVAAELNIAEHLAAGPKNVEEIASITHTHPESLQRLLSFLELSEVFIKQDDGNYNLTEFSQTMRDSDPHTIRPFLLHDDETRWNSFGHLGYSIATGKASFDKLYRMPYFEYLQKNPALSARFDEAMVIISAREDEIIAKTIPFKKRVADIGGGAGHLMSQIAQVHPITAGIVYDLPAVVARVDNLPSTCSIQGGSFFEPLACTADIFILKRILHDWDDSKALQILTNVAQAMDEHSKLYVIDGILNYSNNKSQLAAIDLALLTIFQGRERTLSEFEKLIDAAGLEIVSIQSIDDLICAIECKKNN